MYSDTNLIPEGTWHPKIKDVVYFGMDWYIYILINLIS